MSCLTDEQFEDILQGVIPEPDHLTECETCQERLIEARALRARLQGAFDSMSAGSDLTARIKTATVVTSPIVPTTVSLSKQRRVWSWLAAAAVIAICALPIGVFINTGSQAQANQVALSKIHQLSLNRPDKLFHDDDPNRMIDHLEDLTGQRLVMIDTSDGMMICGCRTCFFKDRKVPTYLVESPKGPVSLVVIKESPQKVGMKMDTNLGVWTATSDSCSMAAVHFGDYTYYALGNVPHTILADIIGRLTK